MKILHITLHYLDGWGYQDNLLPRYQSASGHEVVVATDKSHLPEIIREEVLAKGDRYRDNGVLVRKFVTHLCTSDSALLCTGLQRILEEEAPDLVFHHGMHLPTLSVAVRYRKRHPGSILMVDSHADPFNISRNGLWRSLYSKGVLRAWVRRKGGLVDVFYGVSPLRCGFLHSEYGVPSEKVSLLPLGWDSRFLQAVPETPSEIRRTFGVPEKAFLLVSGGKMGISKGTDRLVEAWGRLRLRHPRVELLLFGSFEPGFVVPDGVHQVGWCDRRETFRILKMADAALWPLLHSTLVEDALACGTPVVLKSSGNVSHYQEDGLGVFMENGSVPEIVEAVEHLMERPDEVRSRIEAAKGKYSYERIAAIVDNDCQCLCR